MDTTIIECSKSSAVVSNENRWTSKIQGGKIVKAGDLLSVEGIAINSLGVGGDIVEIPPQINPEVVAQSGQGRYASNKQSLIVAHYCHHNFQKTCAMPMRRFVGQNLTTGASILNPAGQAIDNTQFEAGTPNVENEYYGSLLGTYENTCQFSCDDVRIYPDTAINMLQYNGARFYFVGKKPDEGTCSLGWRDAVNFLQPPYTSGGLWDYYKTELRMEVDIGYDSPQNIATKINNEINQTLLSSYNIISPTGGAADYEIQENIVGAGVTIRKDTQTTKQSIISLPVNGVNQKPFVQGTTQPLNTENINYQGLAFANPARIIPGYNLSSYNTTKVGIPNINNGIGDGTITSPGMIYCVNNPTDNGAIFKPSVGEVFVTNLEFVPNNIPTLKEFLLSPYNLQYDTALSSVTRRNLNLENVMRDWKAFYSMCDVGRINDEKGLVNSLSSIVKLNPNPAPAYQNPVAHQVEFASGGFKSKFAVWTYFDEAKYKTLLPIAPILDPALPTSPYLSYKVVDKWTDPVGGVVYDYKSMAMAYNLMIVAVEVSGQMSNSGSPSFQESKPVIGLVCVPSKTPDDCPKITYGDYAVFDPGFCRLGNQSIKMRSPKLRGNDIPPPYQYPFTPPAQPVPADLTEKKEYSQVLQVGAPNPTFSFDGTLARFGFSQLDWAYYIGNENGTEAIKKEGVSQAGTQIISFNTKSNPPDLYADVEPDELGTNGDISMRYSTCGIGIVGYKLYNNTTGVWETLLDKEIFEFTNMDEININQKASDWWANSLLERIGFNFTDLFPLYGSATNLYQTTTYGRINPLLLQEPTCQLSQQMLPAYAVNTPVADIVTPQPDLVTPQPDLVTPQPDLVTPQPDLVVPQPDLVVPQPDLETIVPEVPAFTTIYNSTADGSVALVSDFDVANNAIPIVLGNGSKLFTDDGGLANDYTTSHSRYITFDAGAGNTCYINPRDFDYEHSTYSMYDRMGITCSNTISGLSTTAGNLTSTDSTLSQYLYQSSSASPSSFWGTSWVSGNGGYGTGGGYIFPNTAGTDVKGNNNSGWINTWYQINSRYIRFYFKSDGSATEPGWDILIARAVVTPLVPSYIIYTPQPDLIVPQPDLIVPQPDLITPQPDIITPQADLVTPQPDLVEPQPDLVENFPMEMVGDPIPVIVEMWKGGVKPFTTQAYISSTLALAYSVNDYGQPNYDQEYQRGIGYGNITFRDPTTPPDPPPLGAPGDAVDAINVDSQSAIAYASRLPRKLTYPYWLIYSDLIGANFLGNDGQPANVMAIANRAYTSGDFAFNFATDYTFVARKDFVISQITTEILNPDYSKAQIDDGTIILYKVQHPIANDYQPQPGQRATQIQKRGKMSNVISH